MVCKLLRKESLPEDVRLYNATQIAMDMLSDCHVDVKWIPRDQNCVCDRLAHLAVDTGHITLTVAPEFRVTHAR